MSDSWKSFEQQICKDFGGKRRGADYGDKEGGKNDCIQTPGWSIEIKFLASPTWKVMLDNAKNAVDRKENKHEIGIGVVKKKGTPMSDALVIIPYNEFLEYFVHSKEKEAENCDISWNNTCMGTTKEECYACGLPACVNCTISIEWFHFGIQRVCKRCVSEHYGK